MTRLRWPKKLARKLPVDPQVMNAVRCHALPPAGRSPEAWSCTGRAHGYVPNVERALSPAALSPPVVLDSPPGRPKALHKRVKSRFFYGIA